MARGNSAQLAKLKKTPLEFSLSTRNLLNQEIRYPSSSVAFTNHFPARMREIIAGVVYRVR